ncbi:MAG TPA: molybdopterin cofactor-binding domain-containing protein [Gemmatimonadales bacterium]|nr:molybdopterin cofactor-binding domain-containing protein [Gemmatimonadales bacterium]
MTAILRAYPHIGHWLTLNADGTVRVRSGKVEFGQGIRTAQAQIVAHELAVPVARVHVEDVTTTASPDEGVTSGSRSVEEANEGLRVAAAALRLALVDRASQRCSVPTDRLRVVDGCVVLRDGDRIPYGSLVDDQIQATLITGDEPLAEPVPGSPIGVAVPRVDLPAKVFGRPAFVQDLELPGMLHGRVCRPPAPQARLVDCEADEVAAMAGVRAIVRDGTFLAVLAEREEQAVRAARRLRRLSRWGPGPPLPASAAFMLEAETRDVVAAEDGAPTANGDVALRLAATYSRPYLAHASIGPSCAVAVTEGDRYRVWTHSQGIYHLRQELAKVLRVDEDQVEVIHREGAGCYGANGADDAALDAALLARAVPGTPVRLQWMRDDEFAWEPYGTAMFIRISADVAADGTILHWHHEVWGNGHRNRPGSAGAVGAAERLDGDPAADLTNLIAGAEIADALQASVAAPPPSPSSGGGRNANPIYAFPRRRVVNHYVPHTPVRVSALRSLGAHANVFAIESFMDEVADRIGADPIDYRLRYLSDPRAREVIERVRVASEWAGRRDRDGRGLDIGFAQYKNDGAYVAVVADVEIADDIALPRAWAACDAGLVVNPDGLANQLEGGIIQAASWTLKEQVTFTPEGITSRDWMSYPILTFSEAPELHVEIVPRPHEPPRGIGEAVAGPTAAAIANAIFAASGVRLRDMPLTRDRFIRAA